LKNPLTVPPFTKGDALPKNFFESVARKLSKEFRGGQARDRALPHLEVFVILAPPFHQIKNISGN
jgi:hypothetical protein